LRLDWRGYRAGQHDAFADAVDLDSGSGEHLFQRSAYTVEVALDGDVIGRDLLAVGVEKYDIGLTHAGADDVGALRRADHRIGNLRISHQHVLHAPRQVDDHGFADAEREKADFRRYAC